MKKGDVVEINDWSYAKVISNGELNDIGYPEFTGNCIIIETNCKFPASKRQATATSLIPASYNNTVIQAIDTGDIIFIEERFLRPATHKITIDNKTIEISHESYKSFKKQLL